MALSKEQAFELVRDVLTDFSQPGAAWQLLVLVSCLGLSALLARGMRRAFAVRFAHAVAAAQLASGSLYRAIFALAGCALVAGARWALQDVIPTNLLRLALVPLLGIAGIYLAFYLIRRLFSENGRLSSLALLAEKLVTVLVWIGMALYVLGMLGEILDWLDTIRIPMGGKQPVSLLAIGSGLIWVLVTLMLALWFGAWIENWVNGLQTMDGNVKVVLVRLANAILILIAVLISLSLVGIDLTVLSVFGGALGVGLGLGMKNIASNYVSGFIILLDRSLRIGDVIHVDKYSGAVSQIRTRYTVVRAPDGIESIVPNEMLVSNVVQNHSHSNANVRCAVRVQAGYREDPNRVIEILEASAPGIGRVLADPPPKAFLVQFADSGMEFELGFWIGDVENGRLGVISSVNLAIWRAFAAHGIEIPYPQREIRMLNDASAAQQG